MEEAATIGSAPAGAPAGDVSVRLDGGSKHFGAFVAVAGVDLDVGRGEFSGERSAAADSQSV